MSFALQDDQQVELTITAEDAAGNVATDTGTPEWSVDDATILSLSATEGNTVTVASLGVIGTATVSVVDSETNGDVFSGSLAIDVIGGDVSQIVITPGEPEPIS